MTTIPTLHTTLVFERNLPASREAAFAAFADVKTRMQWGTPSTTAALIYDTVDFRADGVERYRCGAKSDPNIHGTTRYLEITPNDRIVYCDTIDTGGKRLCASLVTVEFTPDGTSTRLKTTIQLTSFIGEDMVKGFNTGNNAALDNLVKHFSHS